MFFCIYTFWYVFIVSYQMKKNKLSVLFLCTANSARSQMAEALLRHKAGDFFDVYSAGSQPEKVDLRALEALNQLGINTTQLTSKKVDMFIGQAFDYVITLCNDVSVECRDFPNAKHQLAWDFIDPKTRSGFIPFITTLNELENRLSMFLQVEGELPDVDSTADITSNSLSQEKAINLEPIGFYKNFTDDIRLKVLMLSHYHGELCVCELMLALSEDSQPKVSRNLALLRKAEIIVARKHGQWVFYRINPALPLWAKSVIAQTTENNIHLIHHAIKRLSEMQNRPNKANFCN